MPQLESLRRCFAAICLAAFLTTSPLALKGDDPSGKKGDANKNETSNKNEGTKTPPGGKFALLVGVRQYDPTELKNLKHAEDDVQALADVLLESGYRKENVMLMTQTKGKDNARALPLAANVRKELQLLLQGRKKEDIVVVAFAGHGVQFQGEEENFFCPMDTKLADRKSLVSLQDIYKELEKCEAGMKLLLVDACRNDPQTDNSRSRPEVKLDSATRPPKDPPSGGIAAFYSCSSGQKAYEDADLKHGVFFHFVIEGLRGAAARDGASDIYLRDLEYFVNLGVEPFVRNKLGQTQLPQLLTKLQGTQQPLVTWPKMATPPNDFSKSFPGIDPRYLPGAIGPTDRVNLPSFSTKSHKVKRVITLRQITNHRPADAPNYNPEVFTISPNGTKIAYATSNKGISVINVDGSDNKLIVPAKPETPLPADQRLFFSPDAKRVYWQGHHGPIFRVNSDGTDLRVLTKVGAEYAHPRLRMYGYRIFYGHRGGIYSIDTEGVGDLQEVLTSKDLFKTFNVPDMLLGAFDVSERGSELVCRIWDPDLKRHQLYVMPVGGDPEKDLRLLVKTDFEPSKIAISPDGRQIFFGRYGGEDYLINWDGTGMRKLNLPPVDAFYPIRFTSDGRWLTYTVPASGSVIVKLDGTERVEPYHTGIWHNNNLAIFQSASGLISYSQDLRQFVYVMNFHGGAMPRQLVVGEINPTKVKGFPVLSEIEFPKKLSMNNALPNHTGTVRVQVKKAELDIERVQVVLSPMIVLRNPATNQWDGMAGFHGLYHDRPINDDGKNGDEKGNDEIYTTNALIPSYNAIPGKYALRLVAHEKTSFRKFEKTNAIIVDVDGLEISK